jgi:hypothetical protein
LRSTWKGVETVPRRKTILKELKWVVEHRFNHWVSGRNCGQHGYRNCSIERGGRKEEEETEELQRRGLIFMGKIGGTHHGHGKYLFRGVFVHNRMFYV